MARVLFLREEPEPLGSMLRARGHDPIHVAIGTAVATGAPRPDRAPDAIVVTSAQTPRFVDPLPSNVPVHAVGETTAQALRDHGIEPASVGEGGGADLVRELPGHLHLWHVGGTRRAAEVDAALAEREGTYDLWPVYRIEIPAGAGVALGAVLPVDAILFTSGAQVEAFATLAEPGPARVIVLGSTAEAAIEALGWVMGGRAKTPRIEPLLDALDLALGVSPGAS